VGATHYISKKQSHRLCALSLAEVMTHT